MQYRPSQLNMVWTILLSILAALSLNACSDVNNVEAPPGPAIPGPLKILTASPLPVGTTGVAYDITLAPSGGTPPYTWSLTPGSPTLPTGLELNQSTGTISGTPTITGTRLPEFKLQDSTGQSVEKVLSITVNVAPTPLAILTDSLPSGSINQLYTVALSPTGGTTPYTWGLKAGSPPLPNGLTLSPTGIISGTPTVTSTDTHTFTLTDATSRTVEKPLELSISAIPLSITTTSLAQGTANQRYSETLEATGGTGAYTWRLADVSPDLPTGLTLNASSGLISGIPTGTSNKNYTITVTDQTPPTPQTATKTLRLIIGSAPPNLIITTNSPLPAGTVTQPYNVTLISTGGTGTKTWNLSSGSLPTGLNLSSSGVISGTPTTPGTSSPTVLVRDSGNPQDTATKQLSITINLPAAPRITTTSLPAGVFNVAYNQAVSITGGISPFVWGVTSGSLPEGLDLNASNGTIFGTPTRTGSFTFRLRVTDRISQSDEEKFTIVINSPSPPAITGPSSLPTGTVNQRYPNTQLLAAGGTPPYTWSVNSLQMPGGIGLDPNTGVISSPGGPSQGTNGNYNPTFTVMDSTFPTRLTGTRSYYLSINANVAPVTITNSSLPTGTVDQPYSGQLEASGGTAGYTFSINSGSSLPAGLSVSAAGAITGTPTATNINSTTFRVEDSTIPNQQSATKSLTITINAAPQPLLVTTNSPLPNGKVGTAYGPITLTATGGLPPYSNWSINIPFPTGLILDPSTGEISGTPDAGTEGTIIHMLSVQDSTSASASKPISLTIDP